MDFDIFHDIFCILSRKNMAQLETACRFVHSIVCKVPVLHHVRESLIIRRPKDEPNEGLFVLAYSGVHLHRNKTRAFWDQIFEIIHPVSDISIYTVLAEENILLLNELYIQQEILVSRLQSAEINGDQHRRECNHLLADLKKSIFEKNCLPIENEQQYGPSVETLSKWLHCQYSDRKLTITDEAHLMTTAFKELMVQMHKKVQNDVLPMNRRISVGIYASYAKELTYDTCLNFIANCARTENRNTGELVQSKLVEIFYDSGGKLIVCRDRIRHSADSEMHNALQFIEFSCNSRTIII